MTPALHYAVTQTIIELIDSEIGNDCTFETMAAHLGRDLTEAEEAEAQEEMRRVVRTLQRGLRKDRGAP